MGERRGVRRIARVAGDGPVTEAEVDAIVAREHQIRTRRDEEALAAKIPDDSLSKVEALALELKCHERLAHHARV
jgi:hypothetical protein